MQLRTTTHVSFTFVAPAHNVGELASQYIHTACKLVHAIADIKLQPAATSTIFTYDVEITSAAMGRELIAEFAKALLSSLLMIGAQATDSQEEVECALSAA